MNDDTLTEISHEIDDVLFELSDKHTISPINLSGIVIARLIRMNETANTDEYFYQLVNTVANKEHLKPEIKTLQ